MPIRIRSKAGVIILLVSSSRINYSKLKANTSAFHFEIVEVLD